jgi:ferrous iron transport protein B
MADRIKISLVGKPNSGKSSLFNQLTGLNQKIGNYPGVTVDKRTGICNLTDDTTAAITDLPGIYSLYPRTLDEKIVAEIFTNKKNSDYPDRVVLVADATNLKNSFLLLTQLIDLRLPVVLVLNMLDLAIKSGQSIDVNALSAALDVPVLLINARNGQGIDELKKRLAQPVRVSAKSIYQVEQELQKPVEQVQENFKLQTPYEAYQLLQQVNTLAHLGEEDRKFLQQISISHSFFPGKYQGAETIHRYTFIQNLLNRVILRVSDSDWKNFSYGIDRILTHKVWGYLIFFAVLFLIFQAIFSWAQGPMDLIDTGFTELSIWAGSLLPEGPLFNLISQGIVPGVGGIVIFIPQIAILFGFISVLEETGYMARVVFLMDKIMRKFGLSGKSVVPLMSGLACAIPAIMATRTIENWKDRLITIFVTPFMSCSARLPVFTILVALVIPDHHVLGFISLQGVVMMALYLLGFLAAIFSAFVLKFLIKARERSYLIMELPTYRMPRWSNVGYLVVEKTRSFVFEAGKVILAISVVLWVLASYGPADKFSHAEENVRNEISGKVVNEEEFSNLVAAYKLENSFAGIVGKFIEPAIAPLGYDWKIGIALITSFAAREVFVGTIATIYSLGTTDDPTTIKDKLASEVNPDTGRPRFTMAVGLSLLVFYTLAMQCMSTIAVVKRETKGWKWPLVQLAYMTGLAYLGAFAVYQLLS